MPVNSKQVRIVTTSIDPASVGAASVAEQTFTVPGARPGDLVWINKPTLTTGLGIAGARVTGNNTVAITFVNPTAAASDGPNETYTFVFISP